MWDTVRKIRAQVKRGFYVSPRRVELLLALLEKERARRKEAEFNFEHIRIYPHLADCNDPRHAWSKADWLNNAMGDG